MKQLYFLGLLILVGCAGQKSPGSTNAIDVGFRLYSPGDDNRKYEANYFGLNADQLRDSLVRRDAEIENLKSKLDGVSQYIKPTVFKYLDKQTVKNEAGKFVTTVTLSPVGDKIIPLMMVQAKTFNGAIIENLSINISGMQESSGPGEYAWTKVKSVEPANTSITMVTDKDPGKFQMGINPFQE